MFIHGHNVPFFLIDLIAGSLKNSLIIYWLVLQHSWDSVAGGFESVNFHIACVIKVGFRLEWAWWWAQGSKMYYKFLTSCLTEFSNRRSCSHKLYTRGNLQKRLQYTQISKCLGYKIVNNCSSGSRNLGEGGPGNMKYKLLCSADIFLWVYFTGRGGMSPLPPPLDPLLNWRSHHVFQWKPTNYQRL